MEVEIWSDIACPWCYVGKRRFEAALAAFEHRDQVNLTWRSFELDPMASAERVGDGAEHLAAKYGMSRSEALAAQARMTDVAAADGLDFRFDLTRGGNTFDAHRHLHLAAAHGLQDALKERLMLAYLTEGELISDTQVLERLGLDVGLPELELRELALTDRYGAAVREDERQAREFGISAVPFFVFDRAFGASGAQPTAVLGELLQRAWDARPPVAAAAAGERCGIDGC